MILINEFIDGFDMMQGLRPAFATTAQFGFHDIDNVMVDFITQHVGPIGDFNQNGTIDLDDINMLGTSRRKLDRRSEFRSDARR